MHMHCMHTAYTTAYLTSPSQVGTAVSHEKHGTGKVLELMVDGRTRVLFDSGNEHRYTPASVAELTLALTPTPSPTQVRAHLYGQALLATYCLPLAAYYPGTSPPLWPSSRWLTRIPTSRRG